MNLRDSAALKLSPTASINPLRVSRFVCCSLFQVARSWNNQMTWKINFAFLWLFIEYLKQCIHLKIIANCPFRILTFVYKLDSACISMINIVNKVYIKFLLLSLMNQKFCIITLVRRTQNWIPLLEVESSYGKQPFGWLWQWRRRRGSAEGMGGGGTP